MNEPPLNLEALRAEIVELDRQLLDVAARRSEIVRSIARAKMSQAEPKALFDRTREKLVYERAHEYGQSVGLPRALTQQLVEAVVEASHVIQEQASREAAQSAAAAKSDGPVNFCIVGGAGQMGRRFSDELAARGHIVTVLEKDDSNDVAQKRAHEADVVVVAVPMEHQCAVIEKIAPAMRADALLCDINSLKENVCEAMREHASCEAVGLHPMFGPSVHSLRRQKVVVCAIQAGDRAEWLQKELAAMGMEVIHATAEQHDRMMAVIQVLVHFSTLVMGRALRDSGVDIDESLKFTSPIYRLELSFVSRLFAQNADLYAEIEMANPHGGSIRQTFLDAAAEWVRAIDRGDHETFRELYGSVSDYFKDFSGEAMDLSNRIIDTMVLQP